MVQVFLNFKFVGGSVELGLKAVTARGCEVTEIAVEGCFLRAFVVQLPAESGAVDDGVGVGVDHLEVVALIERENHFF